MRELLKGIEQQALVLAAEWAISMMTPRTVVRWARRRGVTISVSLRESASATEPKGA